MVMVVVGVSEPLVILPLSEVKGFMFESACLLPSVFSGRLEPDVSLLSPPLTVLLWLNRLVKITALSS